MPIEPALVKSGTFANGMRRLLSWFTLGYEYLVFHLALILAAVTLLTWSVLAAISSLVLPRRIGTVFGRLMLMAMCRVFLRMLTLTGQVKLDLGVLDVLYDERSLIIAPNHPSLLDVVLMLSRLPHAICIMKAELWEHVFLSRAVSLARYIRNDSATSMVRLASAAVRAGGQLLIFPEGTRTTRSPVNAFKGGFALIAKNAGVPVQTVFIESNSRFLSKGWPLFRKPEFPLIYRARLGRRFEMSGEVKTFVAEMEDYFRKSLDSSAFPGPASTNS